MLAPKTIRENESAVRQMIKDRHGDEALLDRWLALDKKCKDVRQTIESLKARRNSEKPKGKPTPEQLIELKSLSEEIKSLEVGIQDKEMELEQVTLIIPNLLHPDTPIGKDDAANPELKTWGTIPTFDFSVKSHDEIGKTLDILDFERGVKLSGSRFSIYKGLGAKLERALINFMLDEHNDKGYTEIIPPLLVSPKTMTGTGQLPKFKEDLYHCVEDDLYLIPTAEVPVTNMYQDEIIAEADLPKRFTAYTPCFRREAGTYGKDTAGLIRQHQFNKVELVMYSTPDKSSDLLEELTLEAERMLELLKLPYRRVLLCSGDVGFSSYMTYDLEVWFPSQNCYREISSCSNFVDFQARRAKIRYRDGENKVSPVHTLNGSALAVGRTVAAILENFQQKDGTVIVPSVLQDYIKTGIIN
jgi:seryl-tRNA synthetase